jgi:hypothetical protein
MMQGELVYVRRFLAARVARLACALGRRSSVGKEEHPWFG